ncbi:MAG: prepilin-type N-terminal cleavage/methylation domain-containing protein [Betaproteobacteria bacterium]|nr:prepilin-type N-terminal cleavage/methylation domain-containing protein [Betaproteobacteria bacterium]
MCIDRATLRNRLQRGLSLIELIVFIVIVSVGLAGILTVLDITTRGSVDPMIRKQMLSIAEALLEEVQLQPFTWCDPNDANALTATSAAGCATMAENPGVPGAESAQTRTSVATPFNNVNDYNGCGPSVAACNLASPIPSISGIYTSPAGYSATISVTSEALNGVGDATASSASLRIKVTVSHGSDSIIMEGYRTRYAPNFY